MLGLLRFHCAMRVFVKRPALGFRINVPYPAAKHLVSVEFGVFRCLVVDVGVTPVVIERGEGIADSGENSLALLEQFVHFALLIART